MLYLKDKPLTEKAASLLQTYQKEVDGKPTFAEKVTTGKELFSRYNRKTNPAFKVVRKHLAEMSGKTVRCNYYEDSKADQVEHFYPKSLYPERCFVWENYCYACSSCNQPKRNRFAIFEEEAGKEIDLGGISNASPPPKGQALLLDPRSENPLDYLFLDTIDTFHFVPFDEEEKYARRAAYTIEVLGLNSRSYLVGARKGAFLNFEGRLEKYVKNKERGDPADKLKILENSLRTEHHQTVWHEMIRQRGLHSELNELFNRAPEALEWTATGN